MRMPLLCAVSRWPSGDGSGRGRWHQTAQAPEALAPRRTRVGDGPHAAASPRRAAPRRTPRALRPWWPRRPRAPPRRAAVRGRRIAIVPAMAASLLLPALAPPVRRGPAAAQDVRHRQPRAARQRLGEALGLVVAAPPRRRLGCSGTGHQRRRAARGGPPARTPRSGPPWGAPGRAPRGTSARPPARAPGPRRPPPPTAAPPPARPAPRQASAARPRQPRHSGSPRSGARRRTPSRTAAPRGRARG